MNTFEMNGQKNTQPQCIAVELPTGLMELSVDAGSFSVDELIGFAARANNKRGFLFLSKVLGKHWPVSPALMRKVHVDLASKLPLNLPEPVVFIAMAETAIGLGQGVFEAYKDANPEGDALFLHTTRYCVDGSETIEFEEAHSHAPRQFLHMPLDDVLRNTLLNARCLVLVDDEASTGNTFLNLSNACRMLNPNIERVHLVAITNFMGQAANDALSERFGVTVSIAAALNGEYSFIPRQLQQSAGTAQVFEAHADRGASACFGRLGVNSLLPIPLALAQSLAAGICLDERVLVLGTGEFMHMAFLLGRGLEALGINVVVQSTTRSPILQWGAISHVLSFPDNYKEGVANYIYNVTQGQYDHVLICHETPPNDALHKLARAVDGRLFYFLSENHIEEIFVR
ncbi:phosphoribosyltransferase domain-containing protein [uncultured Deefgea sp.]|uniref:phosphoribosyltransferase domain-containing protein n=1 Tax=uncultured Deefgea sp. TaxID=1304914 RepID=UPI0025920A8B|nr:phosphoribosyltransferase domain-containing protein [uncultured Deefgea sp.]